MSAALPFALNGADPIPGKEAESASVGAIQSLPPDLAHWIHGKRLRVCLTPNEDGLVSVYLAVPAAAMPQPARYGVHLNGDVGDVLRYFAPGTLIVDGQALRGSRQIGSDYCSAFRVAFELDLEPDMVPLVVAALRSCNAIARAITSQQEQGPCSSAT